MNPYTDEEEARAVDAFVRHGQRPAFLLVTALSVKKGRWKDSRVHASRDGKEVWDKRCPGFWKTRAMIVVETAVGRPLCRNCLVAWWKETKTDERP